MQHRVAETEYRNCCNAEAEVPRRRDIGQPLLSSGVRPTAERVWQNGGRREPVQPTYCCTYAVPAAPHQAGDPCLPYLPHQKITVTLIEMYRARTQFFSVRLRKAALIGQGGYRRWYII